MRYGIDLDGVLGNFGARVVEIGNKLWPGKFPSGFKPDNWDYEGYLSDEEWKQVWAAIDATPYFWEDETEEGTGVDDLRRSLMLYHLKDEVFFITARHTTVGEPPAVQSAHWLEARGLWPRRGYSTVLQVEDAKHKVKLYEALNIKRMLDDYAPTVVQLQAEGINAYLLDQPWNRYEKSVPRVYSVAEYLDIIHKL
jgi:hypothetical protein